MNLIILFFSSICALFLPVSVYATGHEPKYVYRSDGRSPSVAFSEGLVSWGENNNVVAHTLGLTGISGDRTSAFVATSPGTEVPMRFLMNQLSQQERGVRGYLYNIRADDNFYYLSEVVNSIYDNHYRRRISEDLRASLGYEIEYVAHRRIPPSQIRSVDIYYYDDNGNLITEYEENPNYIDLDTRANDGYNYPRTWIEWVPGVATLFYQLSDVAVRASLAPNNYSFRNRLFTLASFGYISNFFHGKH